MPLALTIQIFLPQIAMATFEDGEQEFPFEVSGQSGGDGGHGELGFRNGLLGEVSRERFSVWLIARHCDCAGVLRITHQAAVKRGKTGTAEQREIDIVG